MAKRAIEQDGLFGEPPYKYEAVRHRLAHYSITASAYENDFGREYNDKFEVLAE